MLDQARRAVGQLTEPAAKQAMLQAAKGYKYLARAAVTRTQKLDFALGTPSDPPANLLNQG